MKKTISYLLVLSLVLSTFLTVSAATANTGGGQSLENAIIAAKKVINVPQEYTSLSQYSYEMEYDGVKTDVWNLSWSEPQGKGSMSATIDASGNIMDFYRYIYREKTPAIADFSSAEGKAVADAFLKKVWPEYAGQMRQITDSGTGDAKPYAVAAYPSNSFQYTYRLYVNDLPVDFVTVNISVDKYSKEVISFSRSYVNPDKYSFLDDSDLISKEEAVSAYIENIGLEVEYFSHYSDKSQTMMAFPAYVLQNNENMAIDAGSGKVVSRYTESTIGLYSGGGRAMADTAEAESSTKEASLTPGEQSAVDTVSGLLSKAEAEKVARTLPGITSGMKVQSTSLYNEYYNQDQYIWNISFDQCYVSLNAKTGEIRSYSFYSNSGKGNKDIKVDEARKIAESFIQKYAKDKFDDLKYENNMRYYTARTEADGKISWIPNPVEDTVYYYTYARQVDGINFSNNGITISVDKTTGEVQHYNLNWYEGVWFPPFEEAMSKEEAFAIFDKTLDFSISYTQTGKQQATPVYDFYNKETVMLHPETGTRLDWQGQPYQLSVPDYTDISGHWAENIIHTLAENGYYLTGGGELFYPDSNVSQLDFFLYCYSQAYYTDVDQLYDMLIQNRILTEAERNPKANITRQDAAKYISRILGYEKLAQTAIFKDCSKDQVADGYKGYVAIVTGLKIMNVDTKGNFNPSRLLTNAETAAIVYNYLQVK